MIAALFLIANPKTIGIRANPKGFSELCIESKGIYQTLEGWKWGAEVQPFWFEISPDFKLVAVVETDGKIHILNVKTGHKRPIVLNSKLNFVSFQWVGRSLRIIQATKSDDPRYVFAEAKPPLWASQPRGISVTGFDASDFLAPKSLGDYRWVGDEVGDAFEYMIWVAPLYPSWSHALALPDGLGLVTQEGKDVKFYRHRKPTKTLAKFDSIPFYMRRSGGTVISVTEIGNQDPELFSNENIHHAGPRLRGQLIAYNASALRERPRTVLIDMKTGRQWTSPLYAGEVASAL